MSSTGRLGCGSGKTLFYIDGENHLIAVPIETNGASLRVGTPMKLFQAPPTASDPERPQYFPLGADRFVFNVGIEDPTPPALNVLLNWPAVVAGSR